ncbi:methyltransferase domain-containing protein [Pseudarthrobacter sp. NamE2]|uniref:putative RNA methyltransferase n=1 Tax=Pseudarthrobacter sp. NamE2 TaxID=2576838 RepID=UPI0010FF1C70|nr:methyltransferase domain-containing protein [Pseudarthrobacter sp. NamE2]TLM86423.1 methyltransferase domain-containing protein [Pseudarthrobacter sp. NamE2]
MPAATDLPLLCPVCSDPLGFTNPTEAGPARLACPSRHSFDAARQGYFNLLVGRGTPFEADSAAMVESRFNFLAAGHYRPLADALAAAVVPCLSPQEPAVLDSGTGTGQYLRVLLDTAAARGCKPAAVGLDISKFALRRAARLNPDAVTLVWDVWRRLPLADNAVDAVTVVFAPRNAAEFSRVLRPGGRLMVVTPRKGHLAGLAAVAGMLAIEEGKDHRLAEAMAGHFDLDESINIDIPLALTRAEAADLAFMGPAGHHLDRAAIYGNLQEQLEPIRAEALFRLHIFRPKGSGAA